MKIMGLILEKVLSFGVDQSTTSASNMALDFKKFPKCYPRHKKQSHMLGNFQYVMGKITN